MLDQHHIQSLIISFAHEDYCGLFELPSTVSQQFPDDPEDLALSACQDAVAELLGRGLVALFLTPPAVLAPSPDSCEPITLEDSAAVLNREDAWELPNASSPTYWLATTEEGDTAYFTGEFKSL
jgi:hypothetical protein